MAVTNDIAILVLPSWYPNQLKPLDGDFIQRHIMATGLFCRQQVIYVVKDEAGAVTKHIKTEEHTAGMVTETIIYYHSLRTGIALLDKYLSHRKYRRIYRKAITDHIARQGKPNLVHVHVAMKAGLLALWAKKKFSIPFVITEHWGGYLAEADHRLEDFNAVYQQLVKKIFEQATRIIVVTDYLGKAIRQHFPAINYTVIPNVVNHQLFFPAQQGRGAVTRFIHASGLNYQKNPEGILAALALLKERKYNFTMELYGPKHAHLQQRIDGAGLTGNVTLMGEVPQSILAESMRAADALILFSRFETFGCVLIEANASGIPVIVSGLQVFNEIVQDGYNGIVAGNDVNELANKLALFIDQKYSFDKATLAAGTLQYSYENVGTQVVQVYNSIIQQGNNK